jgi:hypothetical protein
MLENHNINNGDEYADLLIKSINEIPPLGISETEILKYWFVEIRRLCIEKYHNYIIGNEETFALNDVELDSAYRLAVGQMVSDSLQELSEKGLLEISIDDNGEILYGLSKEGKKEAEKFNNE